MCYYFVIFILILLFLALIYWYRYPETFAQATTSISVPSQSNLNFTTSQIVNNNGLVTHYNPDGSVAIRDQYGHHLYTIPVPDSQNYSLNLDNQGNLIINTPSGSQTISLLK